MIKQAIVKDKNILILLSLYSFLLLFFCSKMSPLYPINEWSDVNLYYNIGKAIFNGRTLYAEAFDHKGPLIFFIYGIGYAISNTSFIGMFLMYIFSIKFTDCLDFDLSVLIKTSIFINYQNIRYHE